MDLIEQRLAEARAERDRFHRQAEQGLAYREGAVAALEALLRDATRQADAEQATPAAEQQPVA